MRRLRLWASLVSVAVLTTACGPHGATPAAPRSKDSWPGVAAWHRLNALRNYAFRSVIQSAANTTITTFGRYHGTHNYSITRIVDSQNDRDFTTLSLATNKHYYAGAKHPHVDLLMNDPIGVDLRARVLSYALQWATYLRTSRGVPTGSCNQAGRSGHRYRIAVFPDMTGSACVDATTGALLFVAIHDSSGKTSFVITSVGDAAPIQPPPHTPPSSITPPKVLSSDQRHESATRSTLQSRNLSRTL